MLNGQDPDSTTLPPGGLDVQDLSSPEQLSGLLRLRSIWV